MGGKGSGSTPEQRDRNALCGALKRNGKPCRLYAGQGTDHLGIGCCRLHGGNSPNHKKHAVMTRAREEAAAAHKYLLEQAMSFGMVLDVEPVEALLMSLRLSYGHMAWLRFEIGQMSNEEKVTMTGRVYLRMWDEERERVARIAKSALDAGVQERQIQLAERYGSMLADLIKGILGDTELRLTPAQQRVIPGVLRRHLVVMDDTNRDEALMPALPAAVHPTAQTRGRGRAKRGSAA